MRNLFLSLLLSMSTLFGATLVVDNDPEFVCDIGFIICISGHYEDCTGHSDFYSTVNDALNDASNSDTIEICPGTYNESNLQINKNLHIQSTQTTSIDDVIVEDNKNKPIFTIIGWRDGVHFENFTIKQKKKKKNAITIEKGTNFQFKDLKIESKGRGVEVSSNGAFQNSLFENITITSKNEGITLGKPEKVSLLDMNVSSEKSIALDFGKPTGKIEISTNNKNYNIFQAKKIVINIGNENQEYIIEHTNITSSDNDGINIKKASKITIYDTNISAVNSGGIWIKNISNDLNITKVYINSSNENLYVEKANNIYIYDSIFENGEYGIYIKDASNKGYIKNNLIKDESTKGLYLLSSKKWRSFEVINNCFESGSGKNIESKDKNGIFDDGSSGNYWDDWSGSGDYEVPIIPKYDHHPLSDCSLENPPATAAPKIDYRMDECSWDGTTDEVKDSSGNGYDATAKNNATTESNSTAEGGICYVGAFDGSDDYIQNSDLYNYLKTTASLAFWIKTTQTGDDTGWRAPGITGVEQSGGGDDVFWGWIDSSGHIGISKGNSYNNSKSDTVINDDSWHHIVLTRDSQSGDVKIYIDGNLDKAGDSETGDVGTSFSSLGRIENTDSNKEPKYFNGLVDEVKVYDTVLTLSDVQNIYNNENSGKNYDGTERSCNNCNGGNDDKNYKFDAWDTWRSIDDRNISTKIVSDTFDLTIASLNEDGTDYQEFNGTVCATADNNTSKAFFDEQNTTTLSFLVSKAKKDIKLVLSWKKDVNDDCPLTDEDNSTSSTDNFAVRPEYYMIDTNTTQLYAGEDFTIYYKALDSNDENSSDYNSSSGFILDANKTLEGCGDVTFATPTFSDGGNTTIENFDTIGDINLTIKDSNDSNSWAAVDMDDTNDSQRLIESKSIIMTLKPYDINITALHLVKSTEKDWLYMAKDINDMNITLKPTIGVFSKNGVKLKEYNVTCYAEDVNVTFYYDVNRSDDLNLTLDGNLTSLDNSITDINKTLQISQKLFVEGEANSSYSFGIDRVYESEKNVTTVMLQELNITTDTSAKYENGLSSEDNTTFYYAKLYPQDLSTAKTSDTTTAKVLIYNTTQVSTYKEELLHWYIYTPHQESDGNITKLVSSSSTSKTLNDTDGISASSSYEDDGNFAISVDNANEKESTYFIHLDTQNYLWHVPKGFGKDYNESVGSSCSEHPCFEYKYGTNNTEDSGVMSGETNGVSFELNTSKNSRGVRLYR